MEFQNVIMFKYFYDLTRNIIFIIWIIVCIDSQLATAIKSNNYIILKLVEAFL